MTAQIAEFKALRDQTQIQIAHSNQVCRQLKREISVLVNRGKNIEQIVKNLSDQKAKYETDVKQVKMDLGTINKQLAVKVQQLADAKRKLESKLNEKKSLLVLLAAKFSITRLTYFRQNDCNSPNTWTNTKCL